MKTLKWIAAVITLAVTMGVASAHDRDDGPRYDRGAYYGGYYANPYYSSYCPLPFFGGWGRDRDDWGRDRGRWDRDRDHDRDHDRDRRDHRGGRDGRRF
jgi:hypothetical protein